MILMLMRKCSPELSRKVPEKLFLKPRWWFKKQNVNVADFFGTARWFPSSQCTTRGACESKQRSTDEEELNIGQFLLDYRKQKELAEGIGIEEDMEDTGNVLNLLYLFKTQCRKGFK